MLRLSARVVLGGLALLGFAGSVEAQLRSRERGARERFSSVDFMVGATRYDIDRVATGIAGAVRLGIPSGRIFVIEPGIGFFRYENQLGETISYLLPEVSIQVEPPRGTIRPYFGIGAGFTEFLSGRGSTYATMHAATGVRVALTEGWGFRGDIRARTIDPFRQSTLDFTVGVSKRLGSQ